MSKQDRRHVPSRSRKEPEGVKKKTKLSEGQYIIRGSVNTALLLTLLSLPVAANILSQQLGFPIILVILLLNVTMGHPATDEVVLSQPRWQWMLLRYLVMVAFAVLAWKFAELMLSASAPLITFGRSGAPLISTESRIGAQGAVVAFWLLPAIFISSYMSKMITLMAFGRSQEIPQA